MDFPQLRQVVSEAMGGYIFYTKKGNNQVELLRCYEKYQKGSSGRMRCVEARTTAWGREIIRLNCCGFKKKIKRGVVGRCGAWRHAPRHGSWVWMWWEDAVRGCTHHGMGVGCGCGGRM